MAAKGAHVRQAEHNETFYSQLLTTEFLDWAVTAIFYSALHYVDGYLATKNINPKFAHPPTHEVRTPLVGRESNLRHIWPQYRRLKDKSEAARYRIKHFTQGEVEGLKENEFEVIKSHILRHL